MSYFSKKFKEEGTLPNSFYISKIVKVLQENFRPISLMKEMENSQ